MRKICALFGFKRSLFESFNNKRVLERSWADQVCVNIRKQGKDQTLASSVHGKSGQRASRSIGPLPYHHCHVTKKSYEVYLKKQRETAHWGKKSYQGKANKETNCLTPDPLSTMSDLCSDSSDEEQGEIEERPRLTRMPIIQLIPRSSPSGSPKNSPKDSPRGSPRNSPLLFRKLLMNRSINLQRRRFTLAHTPR